MNEDQTVTLPDGRRLGYAEYGDPDGRPVFFFHGWPSSRYQGAYLDPHAKARGLRLLAPERPGIGLSDPLPGRRFADWPKDVAAFADALGIGSFPILGVSGGCPYTLACGVQLADRVPRIAIICGAPPLGSKADRAHMHWVYKTLASHRGFRRAILPSLIPLTRWMVRRGADRAPMSWMMKSVPVHDRDALHSIGGWDMVTRSYLEAIRNGPSAILTEGELYLEPWDVRPEDVQVPARFWHGLDDANLPCEVAKRLAARVPNADGRWVEREGHYSIAINLSPEALDWLTVDP